MNSRIISTKLKDYFLWMRKTEATQPWLRRNLNRDFYKHEVSRIKSFSSWYDNFNTSLTKENSVLDEVSLYVVPIELASDERASISEIDYYNAVGLSLIRNHDAYVIIGLLPYEMKKPDDYRLIRISKPIKKTIINKKRKEVKNALLIQDWDYLPEDHIYLDIPHEKRIIQKLFEENLISDQTISQSFQSPIASAPYVHGNIGGISLVSLSGTSSFAQELIKSVQMMVPPEYREILPPKSSLNGTKFHLSSGVTFELAERPYLDNNIMTGVYGKDYGIVNDHYIKRKNFNGEYSFFSVLNPPKEASSEVWKDLMRRFACNDITISEEIDRLPQADVDLTRLQKTINEDLWIQVVNMRQLNPPINSNSDLLLMRILQKLKNDFDSLLSDVHKEEISREIIVNQMLKPMKYTVIRLSQAFSRSNYQENIDDKITSKVRSLILDNFTGFLQSPKFERIRKIMKKKKRNKRFELVESVIINNPYLSLNEIYEEVKATKFFKDRTDLQELLDWLHKKGNVIVNIDKRYLWVGTSK